MKRVTNIPYEQLVNLPMILTQEEAIKVLKVNEHILRVWYMIPGSGVLRDSTHKYYVLRDAFIRWFFNAGKLAA
jgi:hypothetical protein